MPPSGWHEHVFFFALLPFFALLTILTPWCSSLFKKRNNEKIHHKFHEIIKYIGDFTLKYLKSQMGNFSLVVMHAVHVSCLICRNFMHASLWMRHLSLYSCLLAPLAICCSLPLQIIFRTTIVLPPLPFAPLFASLVFPFAASRARVFITSVRKVLKNC